MVLQISGRNYMQLNRSGSGISHPEERAGHPFAVHQLEKRVKAHVLVALSGYALQVTLKHLLSAVVGSIHRRKP